MAFLAGEREREEGGERGGEERERERERETETETEGGGGKRERGGSCGSVYVIFSTTRV